MNYGWYITNNASGLLDFGLFVSVSFAGAPYPVEQIGGGLSGETGIDGRPLSGFMGESNNADAWFRKAAAQGDASGQRGLGVMYFGGEGVRQSYSEAAKLFRSAADQGDASAQNDLGAMYANGQGVPRSLVQAHVSFNIAASGSAIKKEDRDKAVRNRELVAKKMTAAQIAEAQRLAADRKGISP